MAGDDRYGSKTPETALVRDNIYYILDGDFRKEYEELVEQGWSCCLSFYYMMKESHGSIWSTIQE